MLLEEKKKVFSFTFVKKYKTIWKGAHFLYITQQVVWKPWILFKPYTSSTQYTALIPSSLGLMNELQDFYIIWRLLHEGFSFLG